jgi:hypothetical protein
VFYAAADPSFFYSENESETLKERKSEMYGETERATLRERR